MLAGEIATRQAPQCWPVSPRIRRSRWNSERTLPVQELIRRTTAARARPMPGPRLEAFRRRHHPRPRDWDRRLHPARSTWRRGCSAAVAHPRAAFAVWRAADERPLRTNQSDGDIAIAERSPTASGLIRFQHRSESFRSPGARRRPSRWHPALASGPRTAPERGRIARRPATAAHRSDGHDGVVRGGRARRLHLAAAPMSWRVHRGPPAAAMTALLAATTCRIKTATSTSPRRRVAHLRRGRRQGRRRRATPCAIAAALQLNSRTPTAAMRQGPARVRRLAGHRHRRRGGQRRRAASGNFCRRLAAVHLRASTRADAVELDAKPRTREPNVAVTSMQPAARRLTSACLQRLF